MAEVTMSLEEYNRLVSQAEPSNTKLAQKRNRRTATRRKSRKASAYSKRYGAAFKRIAPKNKKKGGGWKQGGFMRTQKAAHRAAKK